MQPNNNIPFPSILIVEDDEDDIFILQEWFNNLNFQSFIFYTDALSAINYLNSIDDEFLPALIVTDFNLPAVNGFQFVKFLKKHTRLSNIPVVVLTTSMSLLNKKLFVDEGVSRVIIKPHIFEEYKIVASVLKSIAEQT